MIKKLLAAVLAFVAATAFAAVDANKATQAELESIKGIGPAIAGKILDERKKGNFKDWNDLVTRVQGVGDGNAAKFSEAGLTVAGAGFKGAAPAAAKKETAAAAPAKKAETTAAPAKEEKAMAKADPKADKEAAKKAKDEEKAKAKAEKDAAKKAKADEKAKAKTEKDAKPAAKDDKAAKPAAAASAAKK